MAAISSHFSSCFQRPTTTRHIKTLALACILSMLTITYYISYVHPEPDMPIPLTINRSACPINNIDSCIHPSANLTSLSKLCFNITASAVGCHNHTYHEIVASVKFLEEVSNYTNTIIVPGSDIGEELDRFVQKNSRWMIDVIGGRGFEVLRSIQDAKRLELQSDLDRLQHRCTNFFNGATNNAGFGSNWHLEGLGLAHSLFYNMTLFPVAKSKYRIPMTSCSEADMEKAFTAHPPEKYYVNWNTTTINFKSPWFDVFDLMETRKIINPQYLRKGHFWWRSVLTYYATRPNSSLRDAIRQLPRVAVPCMSIHVRHSDKVLETSLIDLPKYMKKAEEYRRKTGVSNVYIMTDDQEVIDATKNYPNFQFQYADVPRSNKGWEADVKGGLSLDIQEKDFLIDVISAAQCEHSIVTYTSNVGRLIGELAFAMRNQMTDVVSLDGAWVMFP